MKFDFANFEEENVMAVNVNHTSPISSPKKYSTLGNFVTGGNVKSGYCARGEMVTKVGAEKKKEISEEIGFEEAKVSFLEETKQLALSHSTGNLFIIRDKVFSTKKSQAKLLKTPAGLIKTCTEKLETKAPVKIFKTPKSSKNPGCTSTEKQAKSLTSKKVATELFNQMMIRDSSTKNIFLEFNSKKILRNSGKGNVFSSAQNLPSGLTKPAYVKPKPLLRNLRKNHLKFDLEGRRPIQILQDIEVLNKGFNTMTEFNLTNFGDDRRDKEEFESKTLRRLFVEKFID